MREQDDLAETCAEIDHYVIDPDGDLDERSHNGSYAAWVVTDEVLAGRYGRGGRGRDAQVLFDGRISLRGGNRRQPSEPIESEHGRHTMSQRAPVFDTKAPPRTPDQTRAATAGRPGFEGWRRGEASLPPRETRGDARRPRRDRGACER